LVLSESGWRKFFFSGLTTVFFLPRLQAAITGPLPARFSPRDKKSLTKKTKS
jgi:hypothetical protein